MDTIINSTLAVGLGGLLLLMLSGNRCKCIQLPVALPRLIDGSTARVPPCDGATSEKSSRISSLCSDALHATAWGPAARLRMTALTCAPAACGSQCNASSTGHTRSRTGWLAHLLAQPGLLNQMHKRGCQISNNSRQCHSDTLQECPPAGASTQVCA